MKTEYLYDPRFAVALIRRDELLAEAAKARLVAEARAGAVRPQTRRLGPVYLVVALVVALVAAGVMLPYLVGATAGQKPAPVLVRYSPPATPAPTPEVGSEDGTR